MYVIELDDRNENHPLHLAVFSKLDDALDAIQKALEKDLHLSIETSKIWIWETGEQRGNVVWQFSGWHHAGQKRIENLSDGMLPGDVVCLYEKLLKEMGEL